jgi:hypothetical protein
MIGFHNHIQINPQSWEVPFTYGRFLGVNFDIGHYVAGMKNCVDFCRNVLTEPGA